ncbi:MAG: two-component system response regulator [Ardenticatenaceae bacterium]
MSVVNSKQYTVLVIDDTKLNLKIISLHLKKAKLKVLMCQNGETGILQAEHAQPDLILLDIMMPKMDGFETCRRLKANEKTKHIPVIFMTALTDTDSKLKGFQAGGVDYVTKPIQSAEVLARINTHLMIRNLQKKLQKDNQRLRENQEALRASEERYALAARGANDGLWDWNLAEQQIYLSPRWKAMLGYEEHEISNNTSEWFNRVYPHDLEPLKAEIQAHLKGLTPHLQIEYRIFHKDGRYHWMLCRGLAVQNERNQAYRMVGSQTDITTRKQFEQKLQHDSTHDALTNLPNRALFVERLEKLVQRAKEEKAYQFAVLFIDLDKFKTINDTLGHLIGDKLLIEVARRLERCLGAGDTAGRFGGDEFAVLVNSVNNTSEALSFADRVQAELTKPMHFDEHEIKISASIGIALSNGNYERAQDIIRDADMIMYQAKAEGRGRNMLFDSFKQDPVARLKADLQQAVKKEQLQLYYQPIISLASNRIVGAEATIHWPHPERGILPAQEFMPLVEESDLMRPLSEWFLRTACSQVKAWQQKGRRAGETTDISIPNASPCLRLIINQSTLQFRTQDLSPNIICHALQESGLTPQSVEFEMNTGGTNLGPETISYMKNLKEIGLQLSIDDMALLPLLTVLPDFSVNTLKLNPSFIAHSSKPVGSTEGIKNTPKSAQLVKSVIKMAHGFNLNVIAKQIETEEQLAYLKAQKCDKGQGTLLADPLPADKFTERLEIETSYRP